VAEVASRLVAVGPAEGKLIDLGGLGVHFKLAGAQTGGSISIVEHPVDARRLVRPHTHSREDELSYVIEGRIGARVGDEVAEVEAGSYVFKPRNVMHTFWNPTDKPARILEMIVPAGFEEYFARLGRLFGSGVKGGSPEHQALSAEYGVAFSGDWIAELKSRYGLKLLGEP
jgi:quercetin dioxygenase-like cupin family protein